MAINLHRDRVRSHTKFGPDVLTFIGYKQTDRHHDRLAKFIYRLYFLILILFRLDSWATIFITGSLYSVFGRDLDLYSITPFRKLAFFIWIYFLRLNFNFLTFKGFPRKSLWLKTRSFTMFRAQFSRPAHWKVHYH